MIKPIIDRNAIPPLLSAQHTCTGLVFGVFEEKIKLLRKPVSILRLQDCAMERFGIGIKMCKERIYKYQFR